MDADREGGKALQLSLLPERILLQEASLRDIYPGADLAALFTLAGLLIPRLFRRFAAIRAWMYRPP
jgi:hypothetical protein